MSKNDVVLGAILFEIRKIGSQKAAAKKWGISPQYLQDVLSGRRPITEKLAAKVGWKLVKTWVMS